MADYPDPVGIRPNAQPKTCQRPQWVAIDPFPVACKEYSGELVARDCRALTDTWLVPDDDIVSRGCP